MNLISIFNKYPDQAACIRHLEAVRWGDNPTCPLLQRARTLPAKPTLNRRALELPCVQVQLQRAVRHRVPKDAHPVVKVALGNRLDGERQEKPVQLPACARPSGLAACRVVHAAAHPRCHGGERTRIAPGHHRDGRDLIDPDGSLLITDEWKGYNGVRNTSRTRSSIIAKPTLTAARIPTRLRASGACSSAPGTASITITASPIRCCTWLRRAGNTTCARTTTPSAPSCGGASHEPALLRRLPDRDAGIHGPR